MAETTMQNGNRNPDLRFGRIKPFAGKRETLEKFLEDLQLHILLNRITDDQDKIAFALTNMEGGDADSWRTAFIKKTVVGGVATFGTWKDFVDDLKKNFKPYDVQGEAINQIQGLRQGTNSIEDHVARFKVLLTGTGVDEQSPAALDYFQRSIRTPLLRKIMDLAEPPTTLEKWYEWALKFDNNYHRLQRILHRGTTKKEEIKTENTGGRKWTFRPRTDPNAMDVDTVTRSINAMTAEERTEFMRKGLCFRCKKSGHISRDCPEKKGNTIAPTPSTSTPSSTATTSNAPKKMTAKELTAHIRTLTAMMNDEEKEEFYGEAEKEGF